jgi:hypothetical protein
MRNAIIALYLVVSGGTVQACDEFQSIDLQQAQELLTMLNNPEASTMERVFAFNTLACSDIPAVRQTAMQDALQISDDRIVRGQVLQEILMQRDAIIVELIPSSDLPEDMREWVEEEQGRLLFGFGYRDRARGCISLYYDSECGDRQLKFNGDNLELYFINLFGQFQFQPDNTMRGYIQNGEEGVVDAKFSLF